MKKRFIITFLSSFWLSMASFAGTPDNMNVWLKNGDKQVFSIGDVDSVTFGVNPLGDFKPLSEWTFLPVNTAPSPLAFTSEQKEYVRTGNEFAKKSFSILSEKKAEENLFYSPISLQIALGLCANGASEKGSREIAEALGFSGDSLVADMNKFYNHIILSLNSPIDSVILKVNNAVWPVYGAQVLPPFLDVARKEYYATVRHLDYVHAPSASKDTIDAWAALMTNDCIKELSFFIDDATTLVINNACYFKGAWNVEIREEMTKKDTFKTITGEKQIVDMMHTYDQYGYTQTDDYQMVELVYGDGGEDFRLSNKGMGTYSMLLVLPAEGKDLDAVFNAIKWDSISLRRYDLDLKFPRYGIKSALGLKDVLLELGVNEIFSSYPNAISISSFVTDVVQDTYIKVNEEGTEAAAVTSIVAAGGASVLEHAEMKVNRPFAFVIREKTTGMLLFMGKVTKVEDVNKEE